MRIIDKTTIKFILVGIVNTLVGTGVMFLLYNLAGASYWVSSAANYVTGSVVSYLLNKYFTFRNNERSIKQIIKFIVNILACYLLAYGAAKPLAEAVLGSFPVNIRENIAMLVGMGLFVALNYVGQRFVVFRTKSE